MVYLDALALAVVVIVLVAIALLTIELTMWWMYCLRNKIVEERDVWAARKRMWKQQRAQRQ